MPTTSLPSSFNVGLKEWASVCAALESGRQVLLLRKGGIYESAGEFEVEHPAFLLFPTYLHQKRDMLKPDARAGFEPVSAEPARVRLSSAGVVTDTVELGARPQMDALDAEHVWTPPLVDMRFNYRPENPLYLLLVRAYRLPEPVTIENTPAYAGCKSWVPLDETMDATGAMPVLSEEQYDQRRRLILERISGDAHHAT